MSWIAKWPLDEASSGTSPTTAADSESSPVDLSITFGGSGGWTSDATGNGLLIDGSATFAQSVDLSGTKLAALNGSKEVSLEVVAEYSNAILQDLIVIGTNSVWDIELSKHWVGSTYIALYMSPDVELVWDTTAVVGAGLHHFVVVYDSAQATAADRLRLYVDGVRRPLTVNTGSLPALDAGFTLTSGARVTLGGWYDNTANWGESVYWAAIADHAVDDAEAAARATALLADNDADPDGPAAYEITADPGAIEITGAFVDLTGPSTYTLTADPASLEISAVTVAVDHAILADMGSLSIEVEAPEVDLVVGFGFVADPAQLELTGADAGLLRALRLVADQRAIDLTGADVGLQRGLLFSSDQASLELTAAAVNLLGANTLTSDPAALEFAAAVVGLFSARALTAEHAALELASAETSLSAGNVLAVDPTELELSVAATELLRGLQLAADPASLALDAALVTLTGPGNQLQVDPTGLEVDAPDVSLQRALRLLADPRALALDAADASLLLGHQLEAEARSLALAGNDVELTFFADNALVADPAAIALTSTGAALMAALVLQADPAALDVAGADVALFRGAVPLVVDPASLTIAAAEVAFGNAFVLPVEPSALELAAAAVEFVAPGTPVAAPRSWMTIAAGPSSRIRIQ